MQVINQKQYLVDDIPAGKCGEWPGIKSNKWGGSIKIIRPIDQDVFSGIFIFNNNIIYLKMKLIFLYMEEDIFLLNTLMK